MPLLFVRRDRLKNIMKTMRDMRDGNPDPINIMNDIFRLVDSFANTECVYYAAVGFRLLFYSTVSRVLAWLSALLGTVCPLLPASLFENWGITGNVGYIFLVFAAAFMGLNKLMGFTSRHASVSLARIELTELSLAANISWQKFLYRVSNSRSGESFTDKGFGEITEYLKGICKIVRNDTESWAFEVKSELARFRSELKNKPS